MIRLLRDTDVALRDGNAALCDPKRAAPKAKMMGAMG
jgi:hypothetical protein